ncbi:IspD/TarI family cytidylyltransferase [soil metagenome]
MTTVAIVLAGGSGSRMGRDDNKVFAAVCGRPLLAWATRTFGTAPSIDELIIVARVGERDRVAAVLRDDDLDLPVHVVTGGATRQDSERAGLDLVSRGGGPHAVEVVLIHDAARPFATTDLIEQVVHTTATVGGAAPALPLGDGVYRIGADGRLTAQPGDLFGMQTPQGFRADALLDAHRRATDEGFGGVDTTETVQRYAALAVAIVPGEPDNIKVTFADDLAAAERIAARRP